MPTISSVLSPLRSLVDLEATLGELLARVERGTLVLQWKDGRVQTHGAGEPRTVLGWSDAATRRTLGLGTVGFCDAYVDGDWDVREGDLVDALRSAVSARLHQIVKERVPVAKRARWLAATMLARSTASRAHDSVCSHYDVGNDFFERWLDDEMTYTCGLARTRDDSLEAMQRQKLDRIFDKVRLREGHRLLDLGCGWGALALRAAQQRGAKVTAVNVSRPQLERLRRQIETRGLTGRVEAVAADYADAPRERFDRVTAVGLAEHVGESGLPVLFREIERRLVPGGVALVHTIGSADTPGCDPWIERRIFPGAQVPTLSQLAAAAEGSGLRVEHVENIGPHYALTLQHWYERLQHRRAQIVAERGEAFCRTWEMYLAMLVPTFEALSTSLFQVVATRGEGPSRQIHGAVLP